MKTTPVIVGGGFAGLSLALSLAPFPVMVIGRPMAQDLTSSELAQGGMAVALGDDDCPDFHARDTLVAGAGHCKEDVVRMITRNAPSAISQMQKWGVAFDKGGDGRLALGLEAAHSRRRIAHAGGDSTGARVMEVMVQQAREAEWIEYFEGEVTRLHVSARGEISGLSYLDIQSGNVVRIDTNQIILATGSASALWRYTTVPALSWGSGLLLAHDVGARLADLEFEQFHPTALDVGKDPLPLVSEAVRGAGGVLVNEEGERFVNSLAPRDVVARAVWEQQLKGHKTFIDARSISGFAEHFPTVNGLCEEAGVDPATDLIPVRPVAHYHMGGIATDGIGRTSVKGLWAIGECACTGLHGANRLASNSLLEAVVMGRKCAEALLQEGLSPTLCMKRTVLSPFYKKPYGKGNMIVRNIMMSCVGPFRSRSLLEKAIDELEPLAAQVPEARLALLITRAALARKKSCGAHNRTDDEELLVCSAH